MLTFILAYTERENGGYLEERMRAQTTAHTSAVCQKMEDLPDLIRRNLPDGVMLDISGNPEGMMVLAERLAREFPWVSILLTCQKFKCNPDLLLTVMRLGVREFLPIPFESEEDLQSALGRMTRNPSPGHPSDANSRGRMVCVLSSKGGSGSTLTATSLAVSLARHVRKSTALVDLNLQLGDVSLFMDLRPDSTIADLAKNIERLDATLLMGMMTKHATGVSVLAAPKRLEEAGMLSASHLQKAYPLLKSLFHWVVVDLPVAFDESMVATLQHADEILLVTLLNIPALRNTKRYLEIFWRLGIPPERVRVIVNRYYRKGDGALSLKEAEKALEQPVFCTIPNSFAVVISAINQGIPLADLSPGSPIVRAFDELADHLNRPPAGRPTGSAPAAASEKKSRSGLFSRLFKTSVQAD